MNAGTSTPRTSVASTRTASANPTPISLMKVTDEVAKARKMIAISAAAAETSRPVRSRPCATASRLSPVTTYSSLIRESRKTS